MSALSQAVEDYLSVRRSLGYKLVDSGRLLPEFVTYLEAAGASTVSTELAVAWATQPTGSTPVWWARRLTMVRGFARHLEALDPETVVPPPGLLPYRCRRVAPYLYSDADIAALMAAARSLPSPQRAATYEIFVGLMAVTGMRAGEVVRLNRDHVDFDEGIVTVWNSKFKKCRAIPLHPATLDALRRYARFRDECCPHPHAPSFLLSTTGTRLDPDTLNHVFRDLVRSAGLEQPGRRRPVPMT
jgi:integrase/recombinase XerD